MAWNLSNTDQGIHFLVETVQGKLRKIVETKQIWSICNAGQPEISRNQVREIPTEILRI